MTRSSTGITSPCSVVPRALPLSSPIRVRNFSAELIVARQIEIIEIQSVQKSFFLDLPGKFSNLAINILLAHIASVDQRPQRGLVLDPVASCSRSFFRPLP